jgi:DNA polymerase III sliding clamp (beta) subunit (PCNA family)
MKLINAINKVKSSDKTSNGISNIYLDKENQKIVATDGNIMSVLNPSEVIKESILIDVPKMAGKVLDLNLNDLTATNEAGLSAKCNNVDANFPDWKRVIPSEYVAEICLDASLLIKLVESLSSSKNTRIKIQVGKDATPLKITNTTSENEGYLMPLTPKGYEEVKARNIVNNY